MSNVTLFSFKTKQHTVIPLEELAPGWMKIRLLNQSDKSDEIVWVDSAELRWDQKLRHQPFDEGRRRQIRQIKRALHQVLPRSLKQWELNFRRDEKPDYEIALWRWLSYTFTRLTPPAARQAWKKDLFWLLYAWMNLRNAQEVLVTTLPLPEISEAEARVILDDCRSTPLEFFDGRTAKFVQCSGVNPHQFRAQDYAAVRSGDEFRALVAPADVIFAVDYASGDLQVLYGPQHLLPAAQEGRSEVGGEIAFIFFALDFDKEARGVEGGTWLDLFAGSVLAANGSCWINGEHYSPPL